MSWGLTAILIGVFLFFVGSIKIGSRQVRGSVLKIFSLNFGGNVKQNITHTVADHDAGTKTNFDWAGLSIAVIGFLTALIGWWVKS
jgi:hypothetical protein